jgi:indole-3-glycerol phosphate synthase
MILDDIAAKRRLRLMDAKRSKYSFKEALQAPGLSFILEIKKASPSKGLIAPEFPYLEIAKEYEAIGAAAISVLTEPDYFLGDNKYLSDIADTVKLPLLRKDFIIDPYQIYEAKFLGASAVLLICALLDKETLQSFYALTKSLGMDALVEVHNESELQKALYIGADIIGINNRDLYTFTVALNTTGRLRKLIPNDVVVVSESGIQSADDIKLLASFNIDAVLIGESIMRAANRSEYLSTLRGAR